MITITERISESDRSETADFLYSNVDITIQLAALTGTEWATF